MGGESDGSDNGTDFRTASLTADFLDRKSVV